MHHVSNVVAAARAAIETRHQMRDKAPPISTGFTDIDCLTAGLLPGTLVLIGGRPSMGTSAFGLNIVQHVVEADHVTGIVSSELDVEPLLERIILCSARVSAATVYRGYPTEADWSRINAAAEAIEKAPLYMEFVISVQKALDSIEQLKLSNPELQVVFVDGLDYILITRQEREQACRSLQQLARRSGLCILIALRVTRAVEFRLNHRALLGDLPESEFADVVLMLYRDDYYNYSGAPSDRAEVIIARNRLGPLGCVELNYDRQLGRFFERVERT